MDILVVIMALACLMLVAYHGQSVILFAPLICLMAVFIVNPSAVAPVFSNVFMSALVSFIANYFPIFLLGAIFGKLIESSMFAKSIVSLIVRIIGVEYAVFVIVFACGVLTYGGVSLFIVIFAVYPFAREMFKQADIPKRFIPVSVVLGAFTFTMDALPGSPQIQNIIPTQFFGTTAFAAPLLGTIGGLYILILGFLFIDIRIKKARRNNEGYGIDDDKMQYTQEKLPNPIIAILPLLSVAFFNWFFTKYLPIWYSPHYVINLPGLTDIAKTQVHIDKVVSIWAIEMALLIGIALVLLFRLRIIYKNFVAHSQHAIGGALLAAMNVGSEYGFGAVIATLPGFVTIIEHLKVVANPLLNQAISINILAGITGSSSGGMSIALGALKDEFIQAANMAHIPMEVLHRVSAMAAGGMDTLPHSGAVITVLAVTGLTHKQAYKDIFILTLLKSTSAFFIIGIYYLFGVV